MYANGYKLVFAPNTIHGFSQLPGRLLSIHWTTNHARKNSQSTVQFSNARRWLIQVVKLVLSLKSPSYQRNLKTLMVIWTTNPARIISSFCFAEAAVVTWCAGLSPILAVWHLCLAVRFNWTPCFVVRSWVAHSISSTEWIRARRAGEHQNCTNSQKAQRHEEFHVCQ